MRTKLLDSLTAIRCFGDQSQVRLSAQEYGYALPNQSMIVNCKNSNLS